MQTKKAKDWKDKKKENGTENNTEAIQVYLTNVSKFAQSGRCFFTQKALPTSCFISAIVNPIQSNIIFVLDKIIAPNFHLWIWVSLIPPPPSLLLVKIKEEKQLSKGYKNPEWNYVSRQNGKAAEARNSKQD